MRRRLQVRLNRVKEKQISARGIYRRKKNTEPKQSTTVFIAVFASQWYRRRVSLAVKSAAPNEQRSPPVIGWCRPRLDFRRAKLTAEKPSRSVVRRSCIRRALGERNPAAVSARISGGFWRWRRHGRRRQATATDPKPEIDRRGSVRKSSDDPCGILGRSPRTLVGSTALRCRLRDQLKRRRRD